MKKAPPITPADIDRLGRRWPDELWGLPSIARVLGVSICTARRWARDPALGLPVTRPAGRWFARRSSLHAWLDQGWHDRV